MGFLKFDSDFYHVTAFIFPECSAVYRLQCSSGLMSSKGLLSRSIAKMVLQIMCMTIPAATIFFLPAHLRM